MKLKQSGSACFRQSDYRQAALLYTGTDICTRADKAGTDLLPAHAVGDPVLRARRVLVGSR